PDPNTPAAKYFVAKDGFANFYFNQQATVQVLKNLRQRAAFGKLSGKWELEGTIKFFKSNSASPVKLEVADEKAKEGTGINPVVRMKVAEYPLPIELYPQKPGKRLKEYKVPEESGGFLAAMYVWRNLLLKGENAFEQEFVHGGVEPYYPPTADRKKTFLERKALGEVINARSGIYSVKF